MNNNMNLETIVTEYLIAMEARMGLSAVYARTASEISEEIIRNVLIPMEKEFIFPGKGPVEFTTEAGYTFGCSVYQTAISALCREIRNLVSDSRIDIINRFFDAKREATRKESEERQARYQRESEERKKQREESKANTDSSSGRGNSYHGPKQSTARDYSTLGCSPSDIFVLVKASYRKLAMKNHPDLGGDIEVMKQINAAYSNLLQDFNNGSIR